MMTDWIGWVATAIFLASYACKSPRTLRLVQAGAALLWVAYGAVLHATPIVVANLLVAGVAVYSSLSGLLMRKEDVRPAGGEFNPASEPDLSRIS
jgi:Bacterial inner membrane protein